MSTLRGVTETGSILDRIVADKLARLDVAKAAEPLATLRGALGTNGQAVRPMFTTNGDTDDGIRIIAEIKKASPSRGVFVEELDYLRIAREYTRAGAVGISVVTEENYFLGNLTWMAEIRRMLATEFPGTRPSVLRKDFLTESYEILQSRAYGADTILLIAALLETSLLRDLINEARELGMDSLVEVHTEAEAERAVVAGATLYGINNRDLHTFDVDLATTERIRPLLPADAIVVGESGVSTKADVERLHRAGVRAILVGEAFMTSPDIAAKMAELRL